MKPVYAAFSSVAGNTRLRLYLSEYQIKKKKKKYSVYIDIYIFTLARRNLEFLTKCESNRADKVREGGKSIEGASSYIVELFISRRSGESSEADYTEGGTAILRNFFEGEIAREEEEEEIVEPIH